MALLVLLVILIRNILTPVVAPPQKVMLDDPPTTISNYVLTPAVLRIPQYTSRLDTTSATLQYILDNYRHPEFNADSSVCHVNEYQRADWGRLVQVND